jgi:endo-1,4-beta-mannosidase
MRSTSSSANQQSVQLAKLGKSVSAYSESRFRNDRQAVFELTRQLVQAQFVEANAELSRRLWNEAADQAMDVDRIVHLMYSCCFQNDQESMIEADEAFFAVR